MPLSDFEREFYARHITLPGFGEIAQNKLRESSVLVVGAGGLGCPALQYLSLAGVGTIGIIDGDVVELNNLHRQVLYSITDLNKPKSIAAAHKIKQLNTNITVKNYPFALEPSNTIGLFEKYDVIIDATDNFSARYLINDGAFFCNKPVVFATVHRFEGQISVFNYDMGEAGRSPNYRDLFPHPPKDEVIPSCAEAGVLGMVPGYYGMLQAVETIKILTGVGKPLANVVVMRDLLSNSEKQITLREHPDNPLRGNPPKIKELIEHNYDCDVKVPSVPSLSPEEAHMMKQLTQTTVVDIREKTEIENDTIGGEWHPQSGGIDWWKDIPEENNIIVYCASGRRSSFVVRDILDVSPNRKVFNMSGGIDAWRGIFGDKNLPVKA